jgi:hypothetical protein
MRCDAPALDADMRRTTNGPRGLCRRCSRFEYFRNAMASMVYVLKSFVGMTLMTAGIVVMGHSSYLIVGIQRCATGGPFVIAQPCPDGSTTLIVMVFVAMAAIAVGAGIHALRGAPPGVREGGGFATMLYLWAGIFLAMAVGAFMARDLETSDTAGVIFLVVLFGLMGLPAAVVLLIRPLLNSGSGRVSAPSAFDAASRWSDPTVSPPPGQPVSPAPTPPGHAGAGSSQLADLERLVGLRDSGAITAEEFEQLKRGIFGGQP